MKESEKSLDPQLWHACAGSMVQIPPLNSKVFYFPQGHAEHSLSSVDIPSSPCFPALVLCRVASLKFMADTETDEVYAKILLIPLTITEIDLEDDAILGVGSNGSDNAEKPASFTKTLTQSDANNGGGFSVPRYCAETIFPPLDYTADPPVQTLIAKDVHGETWKFRHIYRGTPRRHLLTTGWSAFVNHKKLVAGDSIVFLRSENGELRVGVRRAKRPENGNCAGPYGGFLALTRNWNSGCGGKGKLRAEAVTESAVLAGSGQPLEVVYYPRASTPEFCVKACSVKAAMRVPWGTGMRFKMPLETEDSSRISWFMGTVSSVQVADPIRWPNSPWRLLQVTWDEPDLLQSVKRLNPWSVELVSNVPAIRLSPFSPPRKKSRLDFPLDGQFPMSAFSSSCNTLGTGSPLVLSDNAPAGILGARHARFGSSLSDLHLYNKLQSGLLPSGFPQFNLHSRISDGIVMARHTNSNDNISCLLTMGNSYPKEKSGNPKRHQFLLFGQPILTEQLLSCSCSSQAVSQVINGKSSSDGNAEKTIDSSDGLRSSQLLSPDKSSTVGFLWHQDYRSMETGLDIGHCKVFLDSEDVG